MDTKGDVIMKQKSVGNSSFESETIKHIYDDLIDRIVNTISNKDHNIKNSLVISSTINPVLQCLIESVINKIPEKDRQQDSLNTAIKNIQDCLFEIFFQSDDFTSVEHHTITSVKTTIKQIIDDHVIDKIPNLVRNQVPSTSRNTSRVNFDKRNSELDNQIAKQMRRWLVSECTQKLNKKCRRVVNKSYNQNRRATQTGWKSASLLHEISNLQHLDELSDNRSPQAFETELRHIAEEAAVHNFAAALVERTTAQLVNVALQVATEAEDDEEKLVEEEKKCLKDAQTCASKIGIRLVCERTYTKHGQKKDSFKSVYDQLSHLERLASESRELARLARLNASDKRKDFEAKMKLARDATTRVENTGKTLEMTQKLLYMVKVHNEQQRIAKIILKKSSKIVNRYKNLINKTTTDVQKRIYRARQKGGDAERIVSSNQISNPLHSACKFLKEGGLLLKHGKDLLKLISKHMKFLEEAFQKVETEKTKLCNIRQKVLQIMDYYDRNDLTNITSIISTFESKHGIIPRDIGVLSILRDLPIDTLLVLLRNDEEPMEQSDIQNESFDDDIVI